MSHRAYALNSFVVPVHDVDVSHASDEKFIFSKSLISKPLFSP